MSKKDDALKQALDALMEATKIHASSCKCSICRAVIVAQDALASEASEQPRGEATLAQQQEPVAWMWKDGTVTTDPDRADGTWTPLYTSPPIEATPLANANAGQRSVKPWVHATTWWGLTDEERKRAIQFNNAHEALAVVIEAKLKEKNGF